MQKFQRYAVSCILFCFVLFYLFIYLQYQYGVEFGIHLRSIIVKGYAIFFILISISVWNHYSCSVECLRYLMSEFQCQAMSSFFLLYSINAESCFMRWQMLMLFNSYLFSALFSMLCDLLYSLHYPCVELIVCAMLQLGSRCCRHC